MSAATHDAEILAAYPAADVTVERIGDLADDDIAAFADRARRP